MCYILIYFLATAGAESSTVSVITYLDSRGCDLAPAVDPHGGQASLCCVAVRRAYRANSFYFHRLYDYTSNLGYCKYGAIKLWLSRPCAGWLWTYRCAIRLCTPHGLSTLYKLTSTMYCRLYELCRNTLTSSSYNDMFSVHACTALLFTLLFVVCKYTFCVLLLHIIDCITL